MVGVQDLLADEKTRQAFSSLLELAGVFIQQQLEEPDDAKQQKLLNDYYKKSMAIASKRKTAIPDIPDDEDEPPGDEPDEPDEPKKISVRDTKTTACVACSKNHIAAAAGLLAEGKRFLGEGLTNPEVIERINLATQELTTMERGDLHPNNIARLPADEKELATWIAGRAREMRHTLDHIKSKDDYQHAITELSDFSREITKRYYTMMEELSPEKEYSAVKKLCAERPKDEREECMKTMTQVLSK